MLMLSMVSIEQCKQRLQWLFHPYFAHIIPRNSPRWSRPTTSIRASGTVPTRSPDPPRRRTDSAPKELGPCWFTPELSQNLEIWHLNLEPRMKNWIQSFQMMIHWMNWTSSNIIQTWLRILGSWRQPWIFPRQHGRHRGEMMRFSDSAAGLPINWMWRKKLSDLVLQCGCGRMGSSTGEHLGRARWTVNGRWMANGFDAILMEDLLWTTSKKGAIPAALPWGSCIGSKSYIPRGKLT